MSLLLFQVIQIQYFLELGFLFSQFIMFFQSTVYDDRLNIVEQLLLGLIPKYREYLGKLFWESTIIA